MFSIFEWFVLGLWCDAFVLIVYQMNQGKTKGGVGRRQTSLFPLITH